jgi:hypothetical protein
VTNMMPTGDWFPPQPPTGWICPKCGRVYAPTQPQCWLCNCNPQPIAPIATHTTDSTSGDPCEKPIVPPFEGDPKDCAFKKPDEEIARLSRQVSADGQMSFTNLRHLVLALAKRVGNLP